MAPGRLSPELLELVGTIVEAMRAAMAPLEDAQLVAAIVAPVLLEAGYRRSSSPMTELELRHAYGDR